MLIAKQHLDGVVTQIARACLKKPFAVGRGVPAEPGSVDFASRRLIGTIRPTLFQTGSKR